MEGGGGGPVDGEEEVEVHEEDEDHGQAEPRHGHAHPLQELHLHTNQYLSLYVQFIHIVTRLSHEQYCGFGLLFILIWILLYMILKCMDLDQNPGLDREKKWLSRDENWQESYISL